MAHRNDKRRRPESVRRLLRRTGLAGVAATGALACGFVGVSSGDLQSQINAGKSAAASLQSQISAQSAEIAHTAGGVAAARGRLASVQAELSSRIAQLRQVQTDLLAARDRLVALENRLQQASQALAANLRASYENGAPDLMTVILNSRGFSDLLEQVDFVQRIGREDARIVGDTRTARQQVFLEANRLGNLENRDRALTEDVLRQRNQVAALEAALVQQQINETQARAGKRARLASVQSRVGSLQSKLNAIEARAPDAAVRRYLAG
jgi:peptidoglycan hydrolase CwlO-like protein